MNPKIENISEDDDVLKFTLSGINVSMANALRRVMMSSIPCVVFKTNPAEENKSTFITNTGRLNNEILKQRLSCIPIHIKDLEMPLKNYLLEVNEENTTDAIKYVTTEDFKIKNLTTDSYLSEKDTRAIFPPNDVTGYFIDFARLRQRISDEIPGEKLHLTCEFSIATANEDSMFNMVSVCAYGYTPDEVHAEKELEKKKQQWKDDGLSKEKIDFEAKNWRLLDGQRIVKKDSFDFTLQTVGVYTNQELIVKGCSILINKLEGMATIIDTDELLIQPSDSTIKNSYDITLENEDYTIGKILEYCLYSKFFEGVKTVSYCGFKKVHPHDSNSIIRVAYKEDTDAATIKQNLKMCIEDAVSVYKNIMKKF